MMVYVNGELVPKEKAVVSVYDHGFLYGDGIFEGIRVYDGNIFRLKEHIDRLFESAKTIKLRIPMSPEQLIQATADSVAANGMRDCYIRLVISRGPGDLGIDPGKCSEPSLIIIVDKITLYPEEFYEKGISLITASVRRVPLQCVDARIKSLNYLNNILAKIEAKEAGVPEAVMLNVSGRVAECTADNIFLVKSGELRTPELLEGALGGITRQTVMELAREARMEVRAMRLGLHDLYNADECFLTGTGAEIVPVVQIDGRQIATGKPGTVTQDLLTRYRELRVRDGFKVTYKGEPAPAER